MCVRACPCACMLLCLHVSVCGWRWGQQNVRAKARGKIIFCCPSSLPSVSLSLSSTVCSHSSLFHPSHSLLPSSLSHPSSSHPGMRSLWSVVYTCCINKCLLYKITPSDWLRELPITHPRPSVPNLLLGFLIRKHRKLSMGTKVRFIQVLMYFKGKRH